MCKYVDCKMLICKVYLWALKRLWALLIVNHMNLTDFWGFANTWCQYFWSIAGIFLKIHCHVAKIKSLMASTD